MEDTICGISTSMGIGAISIVRLTGVNALDIISKVFDKNLENAESHTIHYGHIVANGEIIDEVLVMVMKAPKTYTVEDVVEINCHGGISTTKKVLEVLLASGARLAEPGEFTKRAYLNGRIDLVEAESVNDLITAKTDAARTLAINNTKGKLTKKIEDLREKIAKILANIEVNIDYPEYTDEVNVTEELMAKYLTEIKAALKGMIEDAKNGQIIKEGINVAIIGKPNVGKSSILNSLLDEEKAIVTNIPGTTRDIVEGSITLNGVAVNFIDTAGIRVTNDVVEAIGVKKSKDIASKADIIIIVLNNNEVLSDEEKKLIDKYNDDNLIIFINKSDLEKKIVMPDNLTNIIYGSTIDGSASKKIKEAIKDKFSLDKVVNKEMSYLSNVREVDLVTKAYNHLLSAEESLKGGFTVDRVEIDLKTAWNFLGELIGATYNDELVDKIFSNFCLGK